MFVDQEYTAKLVATTAGLRVDAEFVSTGRFEGQIAAESIEECLDQMISVTAMALEGIIPRRIQIAFAAPIKFIPIDRKRVTQYIQETYSTEGVIVDLPNPNRDQLSEDAWQKLDLQPYQQDQVIIVEITAQLIHKTTPKTVCHWTSFSPN